ncbi:uncharacterized protein B0H64DRAFT_429652 [Chaetomium fimeti]|uniref:RING-type domain-containing protein n=1 Tax=Chaetomium fimeti TaxID=1854472 RepID=A0AAE0HKW1_9PEZI|nr:hypothetical protein B0H64DRAFT_429652 [Chaetomium fimeti]
MDSTTATSDNDQNLYSPRRWLSFKNRFPPRRSRLSFLIPHRVGPLDVAGGDGDDDLKGVGKEEAKGRVSVGGGVPVDGEVPVGSEEGYETPLFHQLRDGMYEHLSGQKPPFARCPICTHTQLSLRSVPIYTPRNAEDRKDLPDLAPGAMLKCGHMVCRPCWEDVVKNHIRGLLWANESYPPIRCPLCRLKLYHPGCGCHIPAYRMPRSLQDPEASYQYVSRWPSRENYDYEMDRWMVHVPTTLNDTNPQTRHEREISRYCRQCSKYPTYGYRRGGEVPLYTFQVGDLNPDKDE